MNNLEELELQRKAILNVLSNLKNHTDYDCHRCGMYMYNPSRCDKCKEQKDKIIYEKIPYWEERLQKCEQKILKAED